jgi:hypothetical protein
VEQKWGGFPSRAGTFFFKENSQRDASVRVKGGIKVGTKLPFEQDSFSFDPQREQIPQAWIKLLQHILILAQVLISPGYRLKDKPSL